MPQLPLEGIRVLDSTYVFALPYTGGLLADFGAEVIKIEGPNRPDTTRTSGFAGSFPENELGEDWWNRPSTYNLLHRGKRSLTLDMTDPRGRDLFRELVKVSDVMMENYTPRVMRQWELDYPNLRKIKPDIIMVSLSSNGQTGPERNYAGYAPMFAALGGLGHLTGYPDGPPVEIRHGMDHTGGMLAAFAAVAALCAKRGSGLGQHVDVSLRDMGSSFIGPALLDYAMNGREAMRQGNRDDSAAPQGVYRCRGEDAWVSISVASEEEWQGMVRAMGDPDWAIGDEFGDAFRRWKAHDRLDGLIEAWTAQRTPAEATNLLRAHGVAAAPSLTPDQLIADVHLLKREAFPKVLHPEKGEQRAVAPPWRLSGTPAVIDQWTPDLGENNLDVFQGILGLGEAEVKRLQEAKVIW